MTLFDFRIVGGLIFVLSVFGFATGVLHINTDNMRCFDKKGWSSTSWHTFFAVSKLEFRYRDWNYDCSTKYDPKIEKVNDPKALTY